MTRRRKNIALAIAALADAVQLGLLPVFWAGGLSIPDDALDVAVAILLTITLGWRWSLAVALAVELVPGIALFPTWTAFVALQPAADPARAPELGAPPQALPGHSEPQVRPGARTRNRRDGP
jgi:hypothetical protein